MINKEYWEDFYKSQNILSDESDFAKFVVKYIFDNKLDSKKIIDAGCGNARDSIFFYKENLNVTAIDISSNIEIPGIKFEKEDIITYDYKDFELIYMRFIFHTITENELNKLLDRISENNCLIFIETRSAKGVIELEKSETFFKSSVGEEHFRMIYSEEYLTKKISEKFEIVYLHEGKGLSIFKEEDPICIRYILKNKKIK